MGSSALFMATPHRLPRLAEGTKSRERWQQRLRQEGTPAGRQATVLLPELQRREPPPPAPALPQEGSPQPTPPQAWIPTTPKVACSHLRRKRD